MPKILECNDLLTVQSVGFCVIYSLNTPHFFILKTDYIEQRFFIPAGCDAFEQKDLNLALLDFHYDIMDDRICFVLTYLSTLWDKTYHLDIYDEHIEFYYEVFGNHKVSLIHYFEGISALNYEEHFFTKHFNDHKVTAYREYSVASPVQFKKVFNPEPNVYGKQYFEYFEYSLISVNSDFIDYCGGNFYFNPGILCYLISNNPSREWISLGLGVKNGEYLFSDFEYIGGVEFGLLLNYCGIYEVTDRFTTPKIIFCFGQNESKALEKYIHLIKNMSESEVRKEYAWWHGPIICPVGYQYYQTDLFRVRSPKERSKDTAGYFACTQLNCSHFVDLIDKWGIDWKTFIIDVKWFINAGMKIIDIGRWPDMKAFVDSLHKRDKKVIIWWSPWDTEGWPDEECILYSEDACGKNRNRAGRFSKFDISNHQFKLAPDISLPSVQAKVTQQIYHLISVEGINLDGFKLDHTAATPGVFGMLFPVGSKKIYGIELLKYYQRFLYETAKRIKPDALIVGQSPNPYFTDCIDMIRLGDTYGGNRCSVNAIMNFRFEMVKLVDPNWLVDMDGWPLPSPDALESYAEFQVDKGVPSLYYASHLDTTGEQIPPTVFKKIQLLWNEYNQKTQKRNSRN